MRLHDIHVTKAPGYVAPEILFTDTTVTVPIGITGPEGQVLNDEFVYTFDTPPSKPFVVFGWLVKEKATQHVQVLVDEYNRSDGPGWGDFEDSDPYEAIMTLFCIRVPAGSAVLGTDIDVWRIIQDEPVPDEAE